MGQQYEFELHTPAFWRTGDAGVRPNGNVPALIALERSLSDTAPRARAQKAQSSLLPAQAIVFDAFRLTLVQCRWHIAANVAAMIESHDSEALHQLRVGLRRLRVALVSFGGEFRTPQFEAIRLRAKSLAHELAPARDLDVFIGELLEPAARANGSKEAFAVLRARAEAARRRAWTNALLQIGGPRFRMFMADLADVVDHGAWRLSRSRGKSASGNLVALEMPAQRAGERMLAHRRRQACKRARQLETLSAAERHDLRIVLKKLRYSAEFFAPFFDRARVEKFVARLGRMQDILGALNDVSVAKVIIETLMSTDERDGGAAHADISFAAGIVYGWHLERAAEAWRDAVSCWKKFAGAREFWNPGAAH
ncbi:MAG TPA: CHAD domain-containing protein [Rhizomicrobium sp.]